MRKEFRAHRLNAEGFDKNASIAAAFDSLLATVESVVGLPPDSRGDGARELAIVRTKLEEACFYAKKACAIQPGNQERS